MNIGCRTCAKTCSGHLRTGFLPIEFDDDDDLRAVPSAERNREREHFKNDHSAVRECCPFTVYRRPFEL